MRYLRWDLPGLNKAKHFLCGKKTQNLNDVLAQGYYGGRTGGYAYWALANQKPISMTSPLVGQFWLANLLKNITILELRSALETPPFWTLRVKM